MDWVPWGPWGFDGDVPAPEAAALCRHSGFWGTAWCLIYQTMAFLKDVTCFLYTLLSSWNGGTQIWLRCSVSEFLALYPQHAPLLPDTFSFYALLSWIFALLLLSWQLLLGLQRGLRRSPEVLFFPDSSGAHVRHLCHLLRGSRKRMWIAMFTLTDDVLTQEILNAWERKVDVKVILDDEQYAILGADGARLVEKGVPVVLDAHEARMHHKFAVLDDCVLTGSFNWTKQASMSNWENLCILRDPLAVSPFAMEFQKLWQAFNAQIQVVDDRGRPKGAAYRKRYGTPPR